MKLLVISDIHGSIDALNQALSTPHAYDRIVFLGDFMNHGPRNPILKDYRPLEVSMRLNELGECVAVRGNCDSEVDQAHINFDISQTYTLIYDENRSFFITHGHIHTPQDAPTLKCDVFISGHTHIPTLDMINGTLAFNPGSIALPKENHPASYGLIDTDGIKIYTLDHKVYMTHSF